MIKNVFILMSMTSLLLGGSITSDSSDPDTFGFNKYKVEMMGKTLTESETPTLIRKYTDSVKFIGGFRKSFGIKNDLGFMIETWDGWLITHTEDLVLCKSPDRSLTIHFSGPIKDSLFLDDNIISNKELFKYNIPETNIPRHNMPVYKPEEKDISNMPVYVPDSSQHGFLMIADGKGSGSPKQWLDYIKNNFYVLKDSIQIPDLRK